MLNKCNQNNDKTHLKKYNIKRKKKIKITYNFIINK